MGFCVNYVYFISSQVGSVFVCINNPDMATCALAPVVKEIFNVWWFFPILMCVYVPLCWIREMEKLAWSHLLGNVLIITVVLAVISFATSNIVKKEEVNFEPWATSKFFMAFSYSAFAFEGVAVVMPLREIVEDKKNYMKLVMIVLGCIFLMYVIFFEYCIMSYGS